MYQIEVRAISEQHDVLAQQVAREIFQLPGGQLPSLAVIAASTTPLTICTAQLYCLTKMLTPSQINQFTRLLLMGPVAQEATVSQAESWGAAPGSCLEVSPRLLIPSPPQAASLLITYVGHKCVSLRLSSS
jgi:hypothetical protein